MHWETAFLQNTQERGVLSCTGPVSLSVLSIGAPILNFNV